MDDKDISLRDYLLWGAYVAPFGDDVPTDTVQFNASEWLWPPVNASEWLWPPVNPVNASDNSNTSTLSLVPDTAGLYARGLATKSLAQYFTTDNGTLDPIMIAIIVCSASLTLSLLVAAIVICCQRKKRANRRRGSYSPIEIQEKKDNNGDMITKEELEALFDRSHTKSPERAETTAVLSLMLAGSPGRKPDFRDSILHTIEDVKSFSEEDHQHLIEDRQKWESNDFSPVLPNPLDPVEGISLIVARKLTKDSFYDTVWEENISCIIDMEYGGESSFWPSGESRRCGNFDVVASLEVQTTTRVVRNIFMRSIVTGKSTTVSIFSFRSNACNVKQDVPTSRSTFTDFIGLVITSLQNQNKPAGPVMIVESPLMSVSAFLLFAFDAIASNIKMNTGTLVNHVPLVMDDDDKVIVMDEEQINFCCLVVLEDCERSFSP